MTAKIQPCKMTVNLDELTAVTYDRQFNLIEVIRRGTVRSSHIVEPGYTLRDFSVLIEYVKSENAN